MGPAPPALRAVLEKARHLGFLGPGPVDDQLQSGFGFVEVLGDDEGPVLDLGSGGGVPGLVMAAMRPGLGVVLLEANRRRSAFLGEAVRRLGCAASVEVQEARAEVAGRDPARRARFAVVTARGFGAPAVTAECGAPFLAVGGRLLVAEPPEDGARWPEEALHELGLGVEEAVRACDRSFRVLRQVRPCPDRFPRRNGQPAQRPLF